MATSDLNSAPMAPGASPEAASFNPQLSAYFSAQHLLRSCSCSACERPLQEPITLPCGHSTCLSCVRRTLEKHNRDTDSSISSRRPPRFPIAATTIPCPYPGCARGAIGQGLGTWKGHRAQYGQGHEEADEGYHDVSQDVSRQSSTSSPLDGFVAPLNHSLTVVPPQSSENHATHFGISKFDVQAREISSESPLLRTDVTLSKVIEVLLKHSGNTNSPTALLSKPAAATQIDFRPQTRASTSVSIRSRRRGHRGHHTSARNTSSQDLTDNDRTEIHPRFLGLLGASEEGIDSFTVGGVSAVQRNDSSDEECSDEERWWQGKSTLEQSDEDDIGGAFARVVSRRRRPSSAADEDAEAAETIMTVPPGGEEEQEVLYDNGPLEVSVTSSPSKSKAPLAFVDSPAAMEALQTELGDVLECQLCYMLLNQPLTTPCGHTYCRKCFARSLDHGSSCPLCRADMPPFAFFQEHPCNAALMNILQGPPSSATTTDGQATTTTRWILKELYDERQAAIDREEQESLLSTPIFVCTLGFPTMPTILHIFEPRYRLMIRRCLESGQPRFGMVMHSQDLNSPVPGMSPYGTMLEIKSVQMLPDGRSMIETVGTNRFRVLEKGSLDGYTVGRIEPVEDVAAELAMDYETASLSLERWNSREYAQTSSSQARLSATEAQEANTVFQAALGLDALAAQQGVPNTSLTVSPALSRRSSEDLVKACLGFIDKLRSGSAPWLMTRLNDTYGPMPASTDVAAFGYWMALVMPIDEQEKAKLLPIRSARLRLLVVVHWIEQLSQTWWFNNGCSVQ